MSVNTINNPNTYVGDLNNLTTENKSSVVEAINELNSNIVKPFYLGEAQTYKDAGNLIKSFVANLENFETRSCRFGAPTSQDYWSAGTTFSGFATKYVSGVFTSIFTNQAGQSITIATYDNGTNYLYSSSKVLNSNLLKKTNTIFYENIVRNSSQTIDVSSSPICLICIGRGSANLTPVILFRDYWGVLLNITASDPYVIVSSNNGQITIQNKYSIALSVIVIGG